MDQGAIDFFSCGNYLCCVMRLITLILNWLIKIADIIVAATMGHISKIFHCELQTVISYFGTSSQQYSSFTRAWRSIVSNYSNLFFIRCPRSFSHSSHSLSPLLGCSSGLITLGPLVTVPAWTAVMVFDSLIFILTLAKAIQVRKY